MHHLYFSFMQKKVQWIKQYIANPGHAFLMGDQKKRKEKKENDIFPICKGVIPNYTLDFKMSQNTVQRRLLIWKDWASKIFINIDN